MSRDATPDDVLSGAARWCVVHGDAVETMRALPDRSVAHVITDPPYEAEAHTLGRRVKSGPSLAGGGASTGVMLSQPLSFPPLTEAIRSAASAEIARVCSRWIVAFCQVEGAMPWRDSLTAAGARYMRTGVWVKPDAMPQYTGDRPGMGYESIVFCYASPRRSRWNGNGRVAVFTHNKNSGGKHDHETQKPLPLMSELVELFTDPDDLILDPFAGSGTTGAAALRLGRRVILVEREAKWADLCRDRLEAEQDGSTLRAKRAGQVPLFAVAK